MTQFFIEDDIEQARRGGKGDTFTPRPAVLNPRRHASVYRVLNERPLKEMADRLIDALSQPAMNQALKVLHDVLTGNAHNDNQRTLARFAIRRILERTAPVDLQATSRPHGITAQGSPEPAPKPR